MINSKIVEEKFFVVELEDISVLDKGDFEFINSNNEFGFIYIELNQFNNKANLIYNIENKITLKDMIKANISLEQLMGIVKDLIAIEEISKSLIDINKVILKLDRIYIEKNKSTKKLNYIYMPIDLNYIPKENLTIDEIINKAIYAIRNDVDREKLLLVLKTKSRLDLLKEIRNSINKENEKNEKINIFSNDKEYVEEKTVIRKNRRSIASILNTSIISLEILLFVFSGLKAIGGNETFQVIALIIGLILIINIGATVYFSKRKLVGNNKGRTISEVSSKSVFEEGTFETEVLNEEISITDQTMLLNDEMILVYFEDGNEKKVLLNEHNLLGRNSEQCNIVFSSKSISKVHVEIICLNGKYYIVDKNSKNGTFLNGTKIEHNIKYDLIENDEVTLGNISCIFRAGGF